MRKSTTVKQVRESSFDIRATSRLNQLYVELLEDNPKWGTAEPRHDMNHFMVRLIFCFFAQRTGIFIGDDLFTATIEQMSTRNWRKFAQELEVMVSLFTCAIQGTPLWREMADDTVRRTNGYAADDQAQPTAGRAFGNQGARSDRQRIATVIVQQCYAHSCC